MRKYRDYTLKSCFLGMALLFGSPTAAHAAGSAILCEAIKLHVDAASDHDSSAPVFIRSYEPGPGESKLPPPLSNTAFSYDNALAIIALIACDDVSRAKQIGNAFVIAIQSDRTFNDGRIRNAYRAGKLDGGKVALPGWWDDTQKVWAEDGYQDGSQSGNVAWVALALLTLDDATGDRNYRAAALRLAQWLLKQTAGPKTAGGISGGSAGFDTEQIELRWRSTEHNVDVYALGERLARFTADPTGRTLVTTSRMFLDAMFDVDNGMFRLGTSPDGQMQPPEKFALDALIWPLIGVSEAPSEWRASLTFANAHLATSGGFDFNGSRDGLWTEGTAQASFVERSVGDKQRAKALLTTAMRQRSPSGLLYATDGGRVGTGLKVSDQSKEDDFFYFHRPHVGATAWAALASIGFNPFTGRRVD